MMTPNHPDTTGPDASHGEAAFDDALERMVPQHLLEAVVEPVVQTMGYELAHLEWSHSGRHRKLQVFLDRPEGITLDDCSRMSPVVSNALDAAEVDPQAPPALRRLLEGAYTLEVSSPGLDRPLSRRSHFERFTGQRATVRVVAPLTEGSKQRNFHGRIGAVEADPAAPEDDRRGVVELLADEGGSHHIPLVQIRRANLVFEG